MCDYGFVYTATRGIDSRRSGNCLYGLHARCRRRQSAHQLDASAVRAPARPAPAYPLRVRIRRRRDADIEAVVAALATVTAADGYPGYPPRDPAAWLSRPDVLQSWVAERAGELVGHVCLRDSPGHPAAAMWCARTGVAPGACVVLARLFVVPAARGTGLGTDLVGVACAEGAQLGRHPVLDVADNGHAAIRLYERLGWVRLGSYTQPHEHRPAEYLHCFAAPPRTTDRVV